MTNPLPDQIIYSDAAKIAQLLSGSGTVDPTHPPPTATFPANPAMAPSPSPTGSSITQLKAATLTEPGMVGANFLVEGGAEPYLKDATGTIFRANYKPNGTLIVYYPYRDKNTPTPGGQSSAFSGFAVSVNGADIYNTANTAIDPWAVIDYTQLIVDNAGAAWAHACNGQWYKYVNGGIHVQSGAPNTTSPTTPPPPPGTLSPEPPPAAPAPGSVVAVTVATGTLAEAIAAAVAGSTVALVPGKIYSESVGPTKPIVIDGKGTAANAGKSDAAFSGGARIDGSTFTAYTHQKGGIVPNTDCIIRGTEITGFGLQETLAQSTSGLRPDGPSRLVLDNCYIHDNQYGVAGGGFAFNLEINNSILMGNGIGNGQAHNAYPTTGCIRLMLNNVTSVMAPAQTVPTAAPTTPPTTSPFPRITGKTNGGYPIKSRAEITTVNGGFFEAGDAACMDIPDGSVQPCIITGATFHKLPGSIDHKVFTYAEESSKNGIAGVRFIGCTFNLETETPIFVSNGPMDFDPTCVFVGNKPAAQGAGKITGLPV